MRLCPIGSIITKPLPNWPGSKITPPSPPSPLHEILVVRLTRSLPPSVLPSPPMQCEVRVAPPWPWGCMTFWSPTKSRSIIRPTSFSISFPLIWLQRHHCVGPDTSRQRHDVLCVVLRLSCDAVVCKVGQTTRPDHRSRAWHNTRKDTFTKWVMSCRPVWCGL